MIKKQSYRIAWLILIINVMFDLCAVGIGWLRTNDIQGLMIDVISNIVIIYIIFLQIPAAITSIVLANISVSKKEVSKIKSILLIVVNVIYLFIYAIFMFFVMLGAT